MNKRIILASGSPRRRELLERVGIPHEVIVSNVDETTWGSPAEQVVELAKRKADAVVQLVDASEVIVIAADTLVAIDGEILGKPESDNEAFEMLKKLQGNTHMVYTGVAVLSDTNSRVFYNMAQVTFRPLSNNDIWAYIATGEPFDKAGAYGIQEKGAVFVDHINGDFYTVMGLPIAKVCAALIELGYDYWGM